METAPAYYAVGRRGWRAVWTLLHPPYTALHLSFVVVGAALAPTLDWTRLGWALVAFFLGMGVAAHALDEVNGRPLGTRIDRRALVGAALAALLLAGLIGVWGALHYRLAWGLLFVPAGVLLVAAYNLEWWHGRVHTDGGFAFAWGAFPVLVAYFAQTGTVGLVAVGGAAYGFALSLVQRRLSTPARRLRRRTTTVEGDIVDADGAHEPITRETLLAVPEGGLRAVVWTGVLVAATLLVRHL